MPKVAWLCEYPLAGGGDRSLLATLDGIRSAGFEPVAIAPADGELANLLEESNVRVCPIRWHDPDGTRLDQSTARAELAATLRREHPALLHANSLAMARLAGRVAAEMNLSSIGHLRDIVGLSAAAVADLNRNTRLLAVSRATRDFHLGQGLDAEKTFVLYNGVDLERFRPRPLDSKENVSLRIGCIGQIIQRKGQDLLVPLARRLRDESPTVELWIVGDRPSQKVEAVQFEELVRCELAAAAPQQVQFLGRRDDVPELLRELKLLVHPARQEPLGRVLLEAAATGLPIVATDVGGTAEIFPRTTNSAVLVPAGDGERIAEAAIELLGDSQRRAQLGAAARRRAEQQFDARTSAAGLAEHYAAVLG